VMAMSLHCAFNGPVGIHKLTKFPLIEGEHRIKDYFKQDVGLSNSSWAAFCKEVALIVKRKFPEIDCLTKRRRNDLWPLYDPKVVVVGGKNNSQFQYTVNESLKIVCFI